jgi:hypothetical protein
MGNILSLIENELGIGVGPSTAPSASYTTTPTPKPTVTTSSTTTSQTCDSDSTTTTTSNNSSPGSSVPFTGASTSTSTQIRDEIFNSTTFSILFWVLAMYSIFKLGSAIFATRDSSNASSAQLSYSRTIDIVLGVCLIMYLFYWYTSLTETEQDNILGYFISWTQAFFDDPWGLFQLIWFTIIFFSLVYILGVPMAPGASPVLVHLVESKIWILYATFGIIYFFKYVLGIPIVSLIFNNSFTNYLKSATPSTSSIYDTLSKDLDEVDNVDPTTTTNTTSSPSTCGDNQVFNVSNNLYTYEEAQSVCKAFDASLATYDQIENAYNSGGEWCNYGWSEGQMAYFPTQKSTWSSLQKNPKTQNACGRPGVNGGYIKNPYVRFGANCYGLKPTQPANWTRPSYELELEIEPETDEYAELRDGVTINSFNATEWSKY